MKTYFIAPSIGLLVCASCSRQLPLGSPGNPIVIAHRGDSKVAPENTLSAFRSAMKAHACYVELDARSSANGTLYVLHDKTLDRTTDSKAMLNREKVSIAELPDTVINRLDAGKWFDPRFAGERLPTLSESLDVIQAGSMTLLEHKAGTAEAYAKLLRDKRLIGKLIVQSFDWDFLADLHKVEPGQTLGALGDKELTDERLAKIKASGAAVVGWNYNDLTGSMIADLHRRGYKVWAWTPDHPADWDRLIADDIDGIITNVPAQLAQHLQQQPLATREERSLTATVAGRSGSTRRPPPRRGGAGGGCPSGVREEVPTRASALLVCALGERCMSAAYPHVRGPMVPCLLVLL